MNCRQTEERLLDYLEGSLDPVARQEFEAHLVQCPYCRTELDRWRSAQKRIGEGVEALVRDQRPGRSVSEILCSGGLAKRKQPRRLLGLVAAGIAGLVLLSPLFLPLSARVLASTPLIGGYFNKAIAESGLTVAYQAGLVTELDQSTTDGELTLTVTGAYADAMQTTVMYTISGDRERMQHLWDNLMESSEKVSLRDSFGREYILHSSRTGYFDEASGQYHTILTTNALPFYVGRLKLGVQMRGEAANADWEIGFPVQRVSDRLVSEVQVNQMLTTAEGVTIQIDKLVFSPSRTVLHYTMQRPASPDYRFPQWSIVADGQVLTPLGGGSRGVDYSGTAAFFPTGAKELTLRYEGMMGPHALDWQLELKPGVSAAWRDIVFTIGEIKIGDDEARVWAGMQGGFIKFDPALRLQDGTRVNGKVVGYEPTATGDGGALEMTFPTSVDPSQAILIIDYGHGLLPDHWTTTITRP